MKNDITGQQCIKNYDFVLTVNIDNEKFLGMF